MLVLKVPKEILGFQDLQDLLDNLEMQGLKDQKVCQVTQGQVVHQDCLAYQVSLVPPEQLVHVEMLVHRVLKALLVLEEIQDRRVHQELKEILEQMDS